MTTKKKASLNVPTPNKDDTARNFILGADRKADDRTAFVYPWQKPEVTERVTKQYPLKLKEPDYIKATWIVREKGYRSLQQFFEECITLKINEYINELT